MKLELSDLSKRYGKLEALKSFSMSFVPGVYGILGPNGAGKSTLLNMLSTNLRPTTGTIHFEGKDIMQEPDSYRSRIGFMPQMQKLYDSFTARRFLSYIAALKGLTSNEAREEVTRVLALVRLTSCADVRLQSFSGGMRQRVLIAAFLINQPDLLILDEPTTGLDPLERVRIRNLIAEIAEKRIVLIASHIIADVEHIAKRIILLKGGCILANDAPSALLDRLHGQVVEIEVSSAQYETLKNANKISSVSHSAHGLLVRIVGEVNESLNPRIVYPNLHDLYLWHFSSELIEP